jgi:RIO-like serine/threonine protein kinase
MPLKLEILEVVEGEKLVDAGTSSQRTEKTIHVILQEPKPRKFKINLAKATANEINIIKKNQGGVVLMDVGEMVQQGSHALYFKSGSEIDVIKPPVSASPSVIPKSA